MSVHTHISLQTFAELTLANSSRAAAIPAHPTLSGDPHKSRDHANTQSNIVKLYFGEIALPEAFHFTAHIVFHNNAIAPKSNASSSSINGGINDIASTPYEQWMVHMKRFGVEAHLVPEILKDLARVR